MYKYVCLCIYRLHFQPYLWHCVESRAAGWQARWSCFGNVTNMATQRLCFRLLVIDGTILWHLGREEIAGAHPLSDREREWWQGQRKMHPVPSQWHNAHPGYLSRLCSAITVVAAGKCFPRRKREIKSSQSPSSEGQWAGLLRLWSLFSFLDFVRLHFLDNPPTRLPHGGARGKVIWGPWISLPNVMAIHQTAVGIF